MMCAASILHSGFILHTGNALAGRVVYLVQLVQHKINRWEIAQGGSSALHSQQINIYPAHAVQGGEERDYICLSAVQDGKFILHTCCTEATYAAQAVAA